MAPTKNDKNPWKVKEIDSWLQFEIEVQEKLPRDWIYRGHSSLDWKLKSSFYRSFVDFREIASSAKQLRRRINRDEYEGHLIRYFKSNAHFFLQKTPLDRDKLEWLTIMQHYGTPTRLLDWTCSPFL